MVKWIVAVAAATLPAQAGWVADLSETVWNRGAADCTANQDPAIEILQVDADTYVLRQNKCVHFEAPFIYVLFGDHTVFVQDTGATADPARFPLYEVVQSLVAQRDRRPDAERLRLLVTHSHSHGDHTAADPQFRGKPGVTLIEPDADAVREYFKFAEWPQGSATIDLGARRLVVLPAPGHQDESIAVYDAKTGWLLTGDTVYPGLLYIKDWSTYRSSIRRLAEFARTHRVSAVLGTHIEMSRTPGKVYPRGSTFQPDETSLALTVEELAGLDESLQRAGTKPQEITLTKVVVTPIGAFQRVVGGILKWLGVR
jgi:glyoxylase-like metal-dependent hydrolase (beta-lactamase superfamily II)